MLRRLCARDWLRLQTLPDSLSGRKSFSIDLAPNTRNRFGPVLHSFGPLFYARLILEFDVSGDDGSRSPFALCQYRYIDALISELTHRAAGAACEGEHARAGQMCAANASQPTRAVPHRPAV